VTGALATAPAYERQAGRAHGRPVTLEERLESVLTDLAAETPSNCPVCEGLMAPTGGGARCTDCGSELT
jgi:tRNA(Ile2) C34 agmatinyltransferase TiaS